MRQAANGLTSVAGGLNWFIGLSVPAAGWFPAAVDGVEHAKVCHPADLHVTLAFLGDCGELAARAAWAEARSAPPPPVRATLGALERFGRNAFAREVSARPLLTWMGLHRDRILIAGGGAPERRRPKPHVTLFRAQRPGAAESWARAHPLGETVVQLSEMALYTRGPLARPRYQKVESRRL